MNKFIHKLLILLILFNIASLNAKIVLTKEEKEFLKKNPTLNLHSTENCPPYNYLENDEAKGFSIDYAKLIAKKLNIDVTFKQTETWDEILEMIQKQELDVITNISKHNEFSKEINYTRVFHTAPNAIYVKRGNEYLDTLEKLEGKTIVMPKGNFAQKALQKYYPNIKQILVKTSDEALTYLSAGKADAVIGKKNVIEYLVETKKIPNIELSNYVDDNRLISLIRMGLSKERPVLQKVLDKAIKDVSDEEINKLQRKWFRKKYRKKKYKFLNVQELDYLGRKKVITMCNIKDLRPIEYMEDNTLKGISIDVIRKLETSLGLTFEAIHTKDLQEAKEFLKNKKCDIIPTITNVDEFIDIAKITNPYLDYKLAIITKKDKPVVTALKDLEQKRIAKIKDSQFIKVLKSENPYLKVHETKTLKETFEAISKDNAYYALEPLVFASHYMSTYALNDLYVSRYTNLSYKVSMAVRDDDSLLLGILNKSFNNISEKEHREIFNKWTSVSIQKVFDHSLTLKIFLITLLIVGIIAYRHYLLNEHNKKLQIANNKIEEKTKELAKQKLLFEKLYNKSSDGVLLIKDAVFVDCNEAATKILKLPKSVILKSKVYNISPNIQPDGQDSKTKSMQMLREAVKYGSANFEWQFVIGKNKRIWVEVVLTAIEIENKSVIHSVIRDITERKVLEKELEILNLNLSDKVKEEIKKNEENTKKLIQQSRLAQMGEMISMIAHQWRQPLTAISATTNNLLLKMMIEQNVDKDYFKKELDLITDYSQHLSVTIDDFRNFFKSNKIKNDFLIEEIILKSINIIKTSLKANNIELVQNFDCKLIINSFSAEIQQVILNILKNSEDILVEKNLENKKISINTQKINENDKELAQITICDNGGGVNEKIIDKIFDPYFSTKNEKDGTGLGLYMSKIIISDHCKGSLEVHNNDEGAVFTIKLPKQIKEDKNA